ncbi:MAG: response regulator [Acidobacteriota bacterium]|nr:response regulator [Acidobacteriota bacterium]
MFLAKAEYRQDYADRAIIEYTAASHHFGRAGHVGYHASAENNLGLLLYFVGRYEDAHKHLNHARSLFVSVQDKGRIAQVDETRARVLLAQGQVRKAERVIREAAGALEKGGEQALLAEALTTQGRVLARLGDFAESLHTLRRAAELAETAGALEDAGLALLTLVEEHAERLAEFELLDSYRRADELLKGTQDAETVARLRACASRLVSTRLAALGPRRLNTRADFWANFNLAERVRAYEARYIRRALVEAGGSVTIASRLLGYPHHATLQSMLEGRGRHTDLIHLRIPPERRRRAVSRVRAPRSAGHCVTPTQSRQPSILYVEDTKLVAIAVKETLELDGCQVEVCEDGTSGLSRLASGARYDLLIFDQELPGASGVELVQYARGLPHFRRAPIIMVSASDYAAEAMRAGVDVFLKKPDEIWKLSETVARLLGKKSERS